MDVKGTGVDEEGNLATAVETFLKSRVEIRVLSQDGKSLNKMRQRGRKENFLIEGKPAASSTLLY